MAQRDAERDRDERDVDTNAQSRRPVPPGSRQTDRAGDNGGERQSNERQAL